MISTLISYRGDSVHIVFDDGSSLTLPVKLEYSRYFVKGIEINEELYSALRKESDIEINYQKAVKLISRNVKSSLQIKQYFRKKKVCDEEITIIIEKLSEKGLIDDIDYARRFAATLSKRKNVGNRIIILELKKRGIGKDVALKTLLELNINDADEESAYKAMMKKIKSLKNDDKKNIKLWRFLSSRGFTNEIIKKTIKKIDSKNIDIE